MVRTLLVLPNGKHVYSGAPGPAVVRARLTRNVNQEVNLTPGTVCPDLLECTLAEAESLGLQPGLAIQVYHVNDEEGELHRQGTFYVQTVHSTPEGLKLTAKDALVLLEQDLSELLGQESFWPCAVEDLVGAVCQQCGLEVDTSKIPLKRLTLWGCSGKRITGTKLLSWLTQLLGCYCRINQDGKLTFGWFDWKDVVLAVTDTFVQVQDGNMRMLSPCGAYSTENRLVFSGMYPIEDNGGLLLQGNVESRSQYRVADSLEAAKFLTQKVEKVRLKTSDKDEGVAYPQTETEANTYVVQDNPLLAGIDPAQREILAEQLYERLQNAVYSPGTLRVPATSDTYVGKILSRQDKEGKNVRFFVMQQIIDGAYMELRCTGTVSRESDRLLQSGTYGDLNHWVTELAAEVEGLYVKAADTEGDTSLLSVKVGNIESKVSAQTQTAEGLQEQMTHLQQRENELQLQIQSVQQEGAQRVVTTTGYRFDDTGLHIKKSGQAMENQLDYTGMYVRRSGTPVLTANPDGVTAVGVSVKDYLCVGDYARLEDYTNGVDSCRTACYFTGG